MARNWTHEAGRIWPLLVNAGSRRAKITYEEVAPHIQTNPLSVGHALGPIQDYCLENRLAPLTVVVVGKASGVPGAGFIAWDADDLETAWNAVAAQNWELVGNPFKGFGGQDSERTFAAQIVDDPNCSGEVYRQVRDRGLAQRIFRLALLKVYKGQCAACGLSFESALDGAHIVPWGRCTPDERLDVRNGLLLCASHHRLFDDRVFTVTSDFSLDYYDPKARDGDYSKMDRVFALALHRTKLKLPDEERLRPSSGYLMRRG